MPNNIDFLRFTGGFHELSELLIYLYREYDEKPTLYFNIRDYLNNECEVDMVTALDDTDLFHIHKLVNTNKKVQIKKSPHVNDDVMDIIFGDGELEIFNK